MEAQSLAGRIHVALQGVAGTGRDDEARARSQRDVACAVNAVGEFALEAEDDLRVQVGVRARGDGLHAFKDGHAVEPAEADAVRVKASAEVFV